MRLYANDFNRLIERVGQCVSWRKAHWCPCRDPNSGAANPSCRLCTNGAIWEAAIESHLLLAGQKLQQAWAKFGMWEKGDVICSLASDTPVYGLGQNDRVRFLDSSEPFSIMYTNKTAPIVLPYAVASIEKLFWLSDDLTQIINGSAPLVLDDGTLMFGAIAPPAGKQFTLTGRRRPEYYCYMEFPQDRAHFGGEDLPRRVVLRAFDLFSRAA